MYTKSCKIFLQVIMHEGVLSDEDSKELVITLFGNDNVIEAINEINKQLQILNMLVKDVICEVTGDTYWAITSTTYEDVINNLQIEFSSIQLELLRNIFTEIITASNGCVSSTACLNLCSLLDTKMLKIYASEFLDDIVKKKWLFLKDGKYYMGVRSIAELMPYFKATYKDSLNTCGLCKEIIFFGKSCTHCKAIMHLNCLTKYIEMTGSPICATCKNNIDTSDIDESV